MSHVTNINRFHILMKTAILLPFYSLLLLIVYSLANSQLEWVQVSFHSAMEAFGAIIALSVPVIIYLQKKSMGVPSHYVYIFCSFIGLGIFDGLHAFYPPGNPFVWFHSMAVFFGGILMSMIWFSSKDVSKYSSLPLFSLALFGSIAIISLLFHNALPSMVTNGTFTFSAKFLNIVGGLLFISSTVWFYRDFLSNKEIDSILFFHLTLLFGIAGIIFQFSQLWNPQWWLWHLIRFLAYCVILYYIFVKFRTSNEKLHESVKEKEVLLKEVHHRVKNNLVVIQSLLSLQVKDISDDKSKEYFHDAENRVRSMAMIHEMLHKTDGITKLGSSEYIRNLVNTLFRNYKIQPNHIMLQLDVQDIHLDVDTMIPLGLIINELVSNALKYAFPDNAEGELSISLKKADDEGYELVIKDTGVGLPEDFDLKKAKSLGLKIVNTLTKQIDGTLEVSNKDGAEFSIAFAERPIE